MMGVTRRCRCQDSCAYRKTFNRATHRQSVKRQQQAAKRRRQQELDNTKLATLAAAFATQQHMAMQQQQSHQPWGSLFSSLLERGWF